MTILPDAVRLKGAGSTDVVLRGRTPRGDCRGRGDLAQVARGFGLNGTKVTSLGQFERLFREHLAQDRSSLWDIHVDDLIPSRNFRRVHYGEA
jgi:acetolactate synthase I/II/III large subunit